MVIVWMAIILLTCFVGLWLYIFFLTNDLAIPTKRLPDFTSVLAIFPHPDDESLSLAGTLHQFATRSTPTSLAILTKGEKGVEGATLTPSLKPKRRLEILQSAQALQLKRLYQYDLGDGELTKQRPVVRQVLANLLAFVKPDLVITYDQSGLYGHPDHIIISELVTELIQTYFPATALWYISRSPKQLAKIKLPVHMAANPDFLGKRTTPDFKITLSPPNVLAKIESLASHRSQHFGFKKNRKYLPLWYTTSTQVYEYFYQCNLFGDL